MSIVVVIVAAVAVAAVAVAVAQYLQHLQPVPHSKCHGAELLHTAPVCKQLKQPTTAVAVIAIKITTVVTATKAVQFQ